MLLTNKLCALAIAIYTSFNLESWDWFCFSIGCSCLSVCLWRVTLTRCYLFITGCQWVGTGHGISNFSHAPVYMQWVLCQLPVGIICSLRNGYTFSRPIDTYTGPENTATGFYNWLVKLRKRAKGMSTVCMIGSIFHFVMACMYTCLSWNALCTPSRISFISTSIAQPHFILIRGSVCLIRSSLWNLQPFGSVTINALFCRARNM